MSHFNVTLEDIEKNADDLENEKDYWSGKGHIQFFVSQSDHDDGCLEIEVIDLSGCVNGMIEISGNEESITEQLNIDPKDLYTGKTYLIESISVQWTRGDGWETEDDVEYWYDTMITLYTPFKTIKQRLIIWWWNLIGHKINRWRNDNGQK